MTTKQVAAELQKKRTPKERYCTRLQGHCIELVRDFSIQSGLSQARILEILIEAEFVRGKDGKVKWRSAS